MKPLLSFGTLLEWAEYTFYGYMGTLFAALFFPGNDPHLSLLKTYGIFAAGYFMRPLGAIVFGYIGDKWGRRPALSFSLLLMGIATFTIGCLPTYQTFGMYAGVMLLVCRLIQGLAISGEYNGAGIMLVENSPAQMACTNSSWISASAAAGMVCGGIAAMLVSHPLAPDWAWRLPFLLGGASCFLGLRARRSLTETLLKTSQQCKRLPIVEVFRRHKRSLFATAAVAAFTGIFVYIGNIYVVRFLMQFSQLPTHHATLFAIFGEIIVALSIPLFAFYADRHNPHAQYRYGLILITVFMPIIFQLCLSGHYGMISIAMLFYGLLNGMVCGPMIAILCGLFPAELRFTGISFAWNAAAAVFSGTALMVAQYLTNHFDWPLGPAFYVSLAAIITYFLTYRLGERSQEYSLSSGPVQSTR